MSHLHSTQFVTSDMWGVLFMSIKKYRGPDIEPCVIPDDDKALYYYSCLLVQ